MQWESGEDKPTVNQAKQLANKLKIPFGYLFLNTPPKELLEVPDLRTIRNEERTEFSPDFIDVYHSSLLKQQWFKEYRLREGFSPLPFAGEFNRHSAIKDIAESIIQYLQVDKARNLAKDTNAFVNMLVTNAEELGILVFRSGTVGSNNNRGLSVDEFRGFALYDPYSPVVFINTKDAKSAQVFSIIHEFAHIWMGEGGVSNYDLGSRNSSTSNSIESKCDRIAAEVLVPFSIIKSLWDKEDTVDNNIQRVSKTCKVSRLVSSIRAYDAKLINRNEFKSAYQAEISFDKKKRQKESDSPGGPKYNVMLNLKNGRLFSQALLSEVHEGKTLYNEAFGLLGIKKIDTLNKYYNFLNLEGGKAA